MKTLQKLIQTVERLVNQMGDSKRVRNLISLLAFSFICGIARNPVTQTPVWSLWLSLVFTLIWYKHIREA